MPVFARIQLLGPKDQAANAWECWNKVRCLCKHDPRLQLVLVLDVKPEDSIDMRQWYAEPVQIIEISTEMFISNKGNRPVLHKHHQRVMEKWMEFDVAFAVAGTNGKIAVSDCIHYLRYLAGRALELDPAEAASAEYYDILQAPLQPLMDNLDSVTYEVFEQDMSKYEAYEEAMFRAINDFHSTHNRRLVLMVVGAGRGPLVSRAIRAAQRNKADVKVYALEKNPSAFVELQRKNAMLWQNRVTLVHADMRQWEAPEMADILVSELLGSFGDNELSPECLDGAMRLLSLSGVCIPHRYTAYVAPMSSAVLFNRARGHGVEGKLETPFVVNIHAANILDEAQAVWSFEHGASSNSEQRQQHLETSDTSNIHNQRTSSSLFKIEQPSLVHGLAGYFDTELYKDVGLSIVPATHTEGMHSWFSMYFPIKQPLTVKSGDTVTVDMWRRTSGAKTWYEWAVSTSSGATSAIHNTNGHEFWIGQ
ncbi:protein arginine N-methyltransferase 5 [Coemansia spiralis]|nr:protein arginine N-methyltransferase 5 [Coemansia spiralis]